MQTKPFLIIWDYLQCLYCDIEVFSSRPSTLCSALSLHTKCSVVPHVVTRPAEPLPHLPVCPPLQSARVVTSPLLSRSMRPPAGGGGGIREVRWAVRIVIQEEEGLWVTSKGGLPVSHVGCLVPAPVLAAHRLCLLFISWFCPTL